MSVDERLAVKPKRYVIRIDTRNMTPRECLAIVLAWRKALITVRPLP